MNADLWIILTACLVAISCALLGTWLILRKMAMLGDAISHAVLPGIVIAFLFSGSRDNLTMIIGAASIGVLTTFLIEFFHKKARLQSDASIGITFTWLFAFGVILVSYFAGQVDLDQECVLYGEIAYVPLEEFKSFLGFSAPTSFWIMLLVLLLNILLIVLFFRQFYLSTFDSEYAIAIGLGSSLWHYILMSMVSLTTVSAFDSVGAILVLAFIVAPAASAYLISKELIPMLVLSAIFGISASIIGYYLAYFINGSISGAISTILGLQFAVVFALKLLLQGRRRMRKNISALEQIA